MGHKENILLENRLANLSPDERLFRINCGMGWTGTKCVRKGRFMIIENPYPLHAAPEGWPDLVGWESVTITPEMVGQKVAVFTFEEAKTGKLKLSKMQRLYRDLIVRMGGIFRELR